MIAGMFHEGSGLGDQLFRYITVRTLAEEKGYEWNMFNWECFKGQEFMNLRLKNGHPLLLKDMKTWNEKDIRDSQDNDIRSYDPEINFVEDNTIIDGSFEDDKYWGHNLENINQWLTVERLFVPRDLCLIGFRGGEYAGNPDLFLPEKYYREGAAKLLTSNGHITKFEVHTDDPSLAKSMFNWASVVENEQISHSKHTNMGFNWRAMRYSKYAIIPNSAFFILPRILKHFEDPTAVTIAPRYWARHNTKVWARPACYYKCFTYL